MVAVLTNTKITIAIILTIFLTGAGHIYLRYIKRGIIILLSAIAIGFIASLSMPFPYSLAIGIAFWIWQLYDLIQIIKKINSGQGAPPPPPPNISSSPDSNYYKFRSPCPKCGTLNIEGTVFCSKCGYALLKGDNARS